jgi:hypothetical protein
MSWTNIYRMDGSNTRTPICQAAVAKLGQDDKHSLGCNLMLQVCLVLIDASREDGVSCGVRQKPRQDVHFRGRKGKVVNSDEQVPDCNSSSRGGVSLLISHSPHITKETTSTMDK